LPAQVVGHHGRSRDQRRDDADFPAPGLHRLNQRAEITITGKENNVIEVVGQLHHVNRDLNVHVALDLPAAKGIGEFARRLGDNRETVIVQPVDERADGRILRVLHQRGVVDCPDQAAPLAEPAEQAAVIDIETYSLGGGVKIGTVDEKSNTFIGIEMHCDLPQNNESVLAKSNTAINAESFMRVRARTVTFSLLLINVSYVA
jgi:hypothetical protein